MQTIEYRVSRESYETEGDVAGIKKLTNLASPYLDRDEEILSVVKGDYLGELWRGNTISRSGILLATDRNVVLYGKRWTGFDLEFFPYGAISSIECSKGFASIYRVSFDVDGGTVEMTGIHAGSWIDHGDVEHFVSVVRRMIIGDIPDKRRIGF